MGILTTLACILGSQVQGDEKKVNLAGSQSVDESDDSE
jgi:hypothetical protein